MGSEQRKKIKSSPYLCCNQERIVITSHQGNANQNHNEISPHICQNSFHQKDNKGFPGGTVVGSLSANAGDMGSSPGPGGSHVPQSNWAHGPQLPSLCSGACEPQLLSLHTTTAEARAPGAHALQQEKPPQGEARALQGRVAPTLRNWREPACSNKGPTQPKINKNKIN